MRFSKLHSTFSFLGLYEGEEPATPSNPDAAGGGGGNPPVIAPQPSVDGGGDEFQSYVPPDVLDKPWMRALLKSENPTKTMIDQYISLQGTLEKRPGGMPADDASDEDWNNWVSTIQPKDVSIYGDIKPAVPEEKAYLKDIVESGYPPEVTTKMLNTFRDAGLTKRQVNQIMGTYNALQISGAEQLYSQSKTQTDDLERNFDTVFAESFGNEKDKVLDSGKQFLKSNTPDKLKPYIDRLSNEAIAVLAGFAHAAKSKYGKEDTISTGASSASSSNDLITLKKEMNTLMAVPAYRNPMSPEHQSAVTAVKQMGERIAKITKPSTSY